MANTASKPRRAFGVFLLLVVIVGGVASVRWYQMKARAPDAPTFYGNVDLHDVTLAFRIGGRVEAVLKKEGDAVVAGETIARLESAPYRVAADQARATVEVARAELARVEAGARREDISEARAVLAERKAGARRAEDLLQRSTQLAASGAVTAQSLIDAQAAAEQAQAAVQAAEAATTRVVHGARNVDLAVARAQLAQAEAAVATAELSLTDTELKSSTAGVVVTRAIEPGAIVAPGSPALVVAFVDPVWVRAYTAEADLGALAPGTAVEVWSDARPREPYRGQVGYVAAQAEFTPKNVETAELRSALVYRFRVVVTAHDGGLRQGMPVTVRLARPAGSARALPAVVGAN